MKRRLCPFLPRDRVLLIRFRFKKKVHLISDPQLFMSSAFITATLFIIFKYALSKHFRKNIKAL